MWDCDRSRLVWVMAGQGSESLLGMPLYNAHACNFFASAFMSIYVQVRMFPHDSAELMDGKGVAASAGLKVVEQMKAQNVKICVLQDGAPAELGERWR